MAISPLETTVGAAAKVAAAQLDDRNLLTQLASALYTDGTTVNGVSTPHVAAYNPTTSMSVRFAIAPNDWSPAPVPVPFAHFAAGGNYQWAVGLNSLGSFAVFLSTSGAIGTLTTHNSAVHGFVDGSLHGVRIDWTSTPNLKFYTREVGILSVDDDLAEDTIGAGAWAQLGTTLTGADTPAVPATLFAANTPLYVAADSTGASPLIGKSVMFRYLVDGVLQSALDLRRPFADRHRDPVGRIWTRQGATQSWTKAPLGVAAVAP